MDVKIEAGRLRGTHGVRLLLPCNVVAYQDASGKTAVSTIDPVAAVSTIENEKLRKTASQVAQKLKTVIECL